MAWLPNTPLRKDVDTTPCLVCSEDIRGMFKDVTGEKIELMKVICHIVHVNWETLLQELDGKCQLCSTCYKVILDLTKFTEELQLIENQLRSKLREILGIVVSHVGTSTPAAQSSDNSHTQRPNSFQMHFIEESRNWELMREKLGESNQDMVPVDPSLVQIHLNLGHRRRIRNKNKEVPMLCLPKVDAIKPPILERLRRRKAQLRIGYGLDTITGDVSNEDTMECEDNELVHVNVDVNPTEVVENAEPEVVDLGSGDDYHEDDVDSGADSSGSDSERSCKKKRKKKSMVAMRVPWKLKRSGGRVYFKDIEIIKKEAVPPDNEKFKYILECGSCGKEMGQPLTDTPSRDHKYYIMKQHIKAMHLGFYRCEPCQKDYSGPKALRYHLQSSLHQTRIGAQGLAEAGAKLLPKGITKDEDGKIYCLGVELIKTNYESKPGFDLRCSACERVVSSLDGNGQQRCPYTVLKRHVGDVHQNIYKCSMCDKQYHSTRNLDSHFLFHHTVNPPKMECDDCGKPLRYKQSLQKHKWTHKNEEERAAAIAAGEKPPVNYRAFVKRRRQELGLGAEFQCAECGKTFDLLCHLKRHESCHVEKSYECVLCGIIFDTYQERFEHTKSVHNSKKVTKKYNCRLCPKGFKHRAELMKHEKGHIAMPYSCGACFRGFAHEQSLTKHVKRCPEREPPGKRTKVRVDKPEIQSPEEPVQNKSEAEFILVSADRQENEVGEVIRAAVVSHF